MRAIWFFSDDPGETVHRRMREVIGDIIGHPFCPHALDSKCLTTQVKQLGLAIYEDGTYDLLTLLADAIEEAGCTQPDLLAHLRGPGPRFRGCWALDVVLGRNW